jgi:transposase
VDFGQFQTVFTDKPSAVRIIWLFSLVLGFSRLIWARFVLHQDMQAVLRCHMAAFDALGRCAAGDPLRPYEDRRDGRDRRRQHRLQSRPHRFRPPPRLPPQGLPAYRAKTKGKVERPFRYIREDFFLARSFRNLEDMNAQLRHWLDTIAKARDTFSCVSERSYGKTPGMAL